MSFSTLFTFIAAACIASPAFAHIQMINPAPINSPKAGGTDSDYTSPLSGSGSNFPCKGYHTQLSSATAQGTLVAGTPFNVSLQGSAVHGGGSCQFALSYDGGSSWGVVDQVVGGCPLASNYMVNIPADLPAAKGVLFAWAWWNKIGNREMYMNCAAVNVEGTSSGITLPRMLEANVGGCRVAEGTEIDFNNPAAGLIDCAGGPVGPGQTVSLGSGGSGTTPPAQNPPVQNPPAGNTTAPPATTTPPATTAPPASGAATWAADKVYLGGDKACYSSIEYTAKWWTQAETPGAGEVWTAGGTC